MAPTAHVHIYIQERMREGEKEREGRREIGGQEGGCLEGSLWGDVAAPSI